MIVSAGLGIHHAGVEWGFWAGPSDCGGAAAPAAGNVGDFLNQLQTTRVVNCAEAAWRFLGLSLAGWNVLISLALAALALVPVLPGRPDLRLQLAVPVQVVEPALVQVVGRKQPPVLSGGRAASAAKGLPRPHLDLAGEAVALLADCRAEQAATTFSQVVWPPLDRGTT